MGNMNKELKEARDTTIKLLSIADSYRSTESILMEYEDTLNDLRPAPEPKGLIPEEVETVVISGFAGIGKTYLFDNAVEYKVSDSDSSQFSKEGFPNNYVDHIESLIGKMDIVLVSCHEEVRDELVKRGIDFTLVYPAQSLQHEYRRKYEGRGSPNAFVQLMMDRWDDFIQSADRQAGCKKIVLNEHETLLDIIDRIIPDRIKSRLSIEHGEESK